MRYFTYDEADEITAALRHRSDLAVYCPQGGANQTEAGATFWLDVMARFRRGEWADAITAIERRFEGRVGTPDKRQRAILNTPTGRVKKRAA